MKVRILVALVALSSIWASAPRQCKKPEINPMWDSSKNQFRWAGPAAGIGSDLDDSVSPTGTKQSCGAVKENLLKVCPTSDEGKICRGKAKSIFNACYKNGSEDHSAASNTRGQLGKADSSTCMTTYNQQRLACQSRRQPPLSPGQPSVPDTCLQDALAAQNKCLANSH
jgi:hypothetical protein